MRMGRPVKLNRVRLEPKKNKEYAEFIFFGDLHYGHKECLVDKAQAMLDYCLEKRIYVHVMGDLIEAGLRGSVGDSVYTQTSNPQDQVDYVIKMLKPLAKAGLITGLMSGNHEARIQKEAGFDVGRMIAGELEVPYLGLACANIFYVGKQSYTIYTLHGKSSARYLTTKLNAVVKVADVQQDEIVAMGHVHEIASCVLTRKRTSLKRKFREPFKQYILLTGHYLDFDKSYAEEGGMYPGKTGSPKVKLHSKEHQIYTSEH